MISTDLSEGVGDTELEGLSPPSRRVKGKEGHTDVQVTELNCGREKAMRAQVGKWHLGREVDS